MIICGAGFRTVVAVDHGFVHILSHIGALKISLHNVKYTKLSRVAGIRKML